MAALRQAWAAWFCVVACAGSALCAGVAHAALSPPLAAAPAPVFVPVPATLGLTPYDIAPKLHLVATLDLFGVLALAEGMIKPTLANSLNCRVDAGGPWCDPQRLLPPDRSVVGNHSNVWRRVSDWGNVFTLGGAAAAIVVDSITAGSATPAADAMVDLVILAESVGVATLLTHTLKYAIRRPRPMMYQAGALGGIENQLSFPSGHVTSTAAGCAAYATTFALRHPLGWPKYGVVAAGIALTAVTAYGRIGGGMHFYTDVLAGALVGGAVGFLWPTAWRRRLEVQIALPAVPASKDAAIAAHVALTWHL